MRRSSHDLCAVRVHDLCALRDHDLCAVRDHDLCAVQRPASESRGSRGHTQIGNWTRYKFNTRTVITSTCLQLYRGGLRQNSSASLSSFASSRSGLCEHGAVFAKAREHRSNLCQVRSTEHLHVALNNQLQTCVGASGLCGHRSSAGHYTVLTAYGRRWGRMMRR